MKWSHATDLPWLTIAMAHNRIHAQLPHLATLGGDLIIDAPPGDVPIVTSALRTCQTAIVPLQPTTADLSQVLEIQTLLDDVAAETSLRRLYVLSRVVRNTIAARETRTILTHAGIPLADTEIHQSQALARSAGQPVTTHPEYLALLQEIKELTP